MAFQTQFCLTINEILLNPQTRKLINSSTHQLANPHKLINSKTRKLKYSSIQELTISSTQAHSNPSTHQLKNIVFILQLRSDFHSVLAKIKVKK